MQWATAGHASLTRELEKAALGEPSEPLSLRGVVNIGPLMVAMLGTDTVKAALMGYLGTLPEGTATAPRLARLQAIAIELDQLETDEESMVDANDLERRPDARPEIVLAVA